MKIRDLLALTARVSLAMVVIIAALLVVTSKSIQTANEELVLARAIRSTLFERIILRDEYFLHWEERTEKQLLAKSNSLTVQLEAAWFVFSNPLDKQAITEMIAINAESEVLYQKLIANNKVKVKDRDQNIVDEYSKRLMSQLIIKSYFINDLASSLEQKRFQNLNENNRRSDFILLSFFIVTIAFVLVSSLAIARYISKGIDHLLKGTQAIGGGNFKYRINLNQKNEISDVAQAINLMAAALMKSFTSVENLEREVEQRMRAEIEVGKLNANLEERVMLRTTQLNAANKELEAFAYSISHDLKAPLRSIKGFSQIVLEDYSKKLDKDGARLLGIIMDSATKLETLISEILSLSRYSMIELNFSLIDMKSMAAEVFDEIASNEEKAEIVFRLEDIPSAWGDPNLIRQVWRNLISNAVKYTGKSKDRNIHIDASIAEGQLRYRIADSGTGFNMAYASKLFQLFQRLHTSEDFAGSGVGLAIVKRLVERHRGEVGAESKEGEGATFWFSLPDNTTAL